MTLGKEENPINILQGRQAMGDNKTGHIMVSFGESLPEEVFIGCIETGGNVIEKEYLGFLGQGTGDGKPLFLTPGEAYTPLAQEGLVFEGEGFDFPFHLSDGNRLFKGFLGDLSTYAGASKGYIFPDGP